MANSNMLAYFSLITLLLSLINQFPITNANKNQTINSHNHKQGFSLRLYHRDSPDSPMNRANYTKAHKLKEYIRASKLRLSSLASTGRTNTSQNTTIDDIKIIRPSISAQEPYYIVEVGIGTFRDTNPPYKTYFLMLDLDTASDLTWTQCQGCEDCFHQVDPLFPADQSLSCVAVKCDDCPQSGCWQEKCFESRLYSDRSLVRAFLATELFSFKYDNKLHPAQMNMRFGCGINILDFTAGDNPNNKISGKLGLGHGNLSIIHQAKETTSLLFSYCLQHITHHGEGLQPMYLRFGTDVIFPPNYQSTPLLYEEGKHFHFLDLQRIKVAYDYLDIPSPALESCIIDTSSPVTQLNRVAYAIFRDAIANGVEQHNQNVARVKYEDFDLCYKRVREPVTVNLPYVYFRFANGAEFEITNLALFNIFNDAQGNAMICLMVNEIQDDERMIILGAYQQTNQRIIYDLNNEQLHFALDDCSKNN